MKINKRGFTLIELLVVVLIIGVLTAIALPQYEKAVEKSKASQALTLLRALVSAQEEYYLANGTYATSFDDLSVQIPWTGNQPWLTGLPTKSNQDWSAQLYTANAGKGIAIARISGPYAGAAFMYIFEARPGDIYENLDNQIICFERYYYGAVNFTKARGSYCKKIFSDFPFSYTE